MGRFLVPLVLFLALVVLLYVGLGRDPSRIHSPLIGKPAPAFTLADLANPDRHVTEQDLRAAPVSVLNVWASWCVACRAEHAVLSSLADRRVAPVFGLNYKDQRVDALAWLEHFGNPYKANAHDLSGRVGIDWGVYGVPETFVIDRRGVIRYKHVGPLTEDIVEDQIIPLLREIREEFS
ncbi:MAG: DsbE family thiol:disulfide interchange protein [Pseudomonadota bacterium]|nr:DsbE family thiol:disulfide interchange protein [Pseudomonadota bacterium]